MCELLLLLLLPVMRPKEVLPKLLSCCCCCCHWSCCCIRLQLSARCCTAVQACRLLCFIFFCIQRQPSITPHRALPSSLAAATSKSMWVASAARSC